MLLLFEFWYAVITVEDVPNHEGILRDTSQHFLNFKSIRQNRHQKTLSHIREIKKIIEEITQLCLPIIIIITLCTSSGPKFRTTLKRIPLEVPGSNRTPLIPLTTYAVTCTMT